MIENHVHLSQGDLPLTTGGELTFVKTRETGELETAGFHSDIKRDISLQFARRLARRFHGILIECDREITNRGSVYAIVEFPSRNKSDPDVSSQSSYKIAIRPDVDVIEVNLPPSASIDNFESNISCIYTCALDAGLAPRRTSRGKCIGTRGGFHLTFSVPGENVGARVATMNLAVGFIELTFNWPFLSYLFCGDRSGPDGFHPRLDEVVSDGRERIRVMHSIAALYKERGNTEPACWQRIAVAMMHLMRDRFGRSHVVEISLDKLWSPDPARNLGIVELRQFEMTETDKLAIAQARFVWSIASIINRGESSPRGFSIERSNPDIMDFDLVRFFSLYALNERGSDIRDLLRISEARYPIIYSIPLSDCCLRLRLGRAETFCEYCEIGGELREIFAPYRVCFSVGAFFFRSEDGAAIVSMTLELFDSFFDIRDYLLTGAGPRNGEILDVISDAVKCHLRSEIEPLINDTKSWRGVDILRHAIEALGNRETEFICPDLKFRGKFRIDRSVNIEDITRVRLQDNAWLP